MQTLGEQSCARAKRSAGFAPKATFDLTFYDRPDNVPSTACGAEGRYIQLNPSIVIVLPRGGPISIIIDSRRRPDQLGVPDELQADEYVFAYWRHHSRRTCKRTLTLGQWG